MITRQSCYDALFKLKGAGIDVKEQLEIMRTKSNVPQEVLDFLRDNSPQFQFYNSIHKYQRGLAKNIRNWKSLDNLGKIKVCSSLITRAAISVEKHNLDESLLEDLELYKVSEALHEAILTNNFEKLDSVLKNTCESLNLFYRIKGVDLNEGD